MDTVKPFADLIRAVARTRIFPTKGKIAARSLRGRERVKRIAWEVAERSQWQVLF